MTFKIKYLFLCSFLFIFWIALRNVMKSCVSYGNGLFVQCKCKWSVSPILAREQQVKRAKVTAFCSSQIIYAWNIFSFWMKIMIEEFYSKNWTKKRKNPPPQKKKKMLKKALEKCNQLKPEVLQIHNNLDGAWDEVGKFKVAAHQNLSCTL